MKGIFWFLPMEVSLHASLHRWSVLPCVARRVLLGFRGRLLGFKAWLSNITILPWRGYLSPAFACNSF